MIETRYNSIVGEFQTIHVIHITQWQANILSTNVSTCCYRETEIEDIAIAIHYVFMVSLDSRTFL